MHTRSINTSWHPTNKVLNKHLKGLKLYNDHYKNLVSQMVVSIFNSYVHNSKTRRDGKNTGCRFGFSTSKLFVFIKGTIVTFFVFTGCCLNNIKKDMRGPLKCSSPSSVDKFNQIKNHIIVVCGKC